MSKKRGIQFDVVSAIADNLVGQGFKPDDISAGAIREETGTGSLTTIIAHLNRWRSQSRPPVAGVEITTDSMAPITAAVTALIHEVSDRVREEGRRIGAAAAIEAERVRAELDEALALNEEIETEREAAVAQAEALRAQVEQLRLSEARLMGKVEALERAFTQIDRINADPMHAVQATADALGAPGAHSDAGSIVGGETNEATSDKRLGHMPAPDTTEPQMFGGDRPEAPAALPS